MKITQATVAALTPNNTDRIEWDDDLPGFGVRMKPNGRKAFLVQYRFPPGRHGRTRRMTLGPTSKVRAAEARQQAHRLLGSVKLGADPAAERKAKMEQAGDTIDAMARTWLKRDQAGNRSVGEVERIIAREVLPPWGMRSVHSIAKRDVIELLDAIADRGAPITANRTLAYVRRMFAWCVERDILPASPAVGVKGPGREIKRDRALSDAELVRVWRAAGGMGYPFGSMVQLLILTGARRDELRETTWSEIDLPGSTIRLPAQRSKSAEGRGIALSPPAVEILSVLPRVQTSDGEGSRVVFTTNGKTPFSGLSKAKARLDAAAGAIDAAGNALDKPEPLAPWTLHDIRRTVATGLQRLGERLEVIEAVLGHVSGSRAGIVGIYQRHSFDAEARKALGRWADHLQGLLSPPDSSTVVPFRAAKASA